jgi:hypothetical protein
MIFLLDEHADPSFDGNYIVWGYRCIGNLDVTFMISTQERRNL